ncbi:hypothetical protein TSUD_150650 [Trifolium subterraneum]|uniref:Uncharacterized protein n=1 Tax=Trifolium subterraneum TaxID=3900 RepID=A0A2Z6M0I6_TRISU|nr:hypothetical protein TSUD_150650 [Trifolium subterraneum]
MGKRKRRKEEIAEDCCFMCKDGGEMRVPIIATNAVDHRSLCVCAAQQLFVENATMGLNLLLSKETKDFVGTAQNLHFLLRTTLTLILME